MPKSMKKKPVKMAQTRPQSKQARTAIPSRSYLKKVTKPTSPTVQNIERWAKLIIQVVRAHLADQAFTRDDLLYHLSKLRIDGEEEWSEDAAGVNDTATTTRHRKICDAVRFLLAGRELAELSGYRLCVYELRSNLAQTPPLALAYLDTIRRLVEQFPAATKIDGMAVVSRWRSDQHLPENIKKMTVRAALPILTKEGVVRRGDYLHQYVVKAKG